MSEAARSRWVRAMTADDVTAVLAIQAECYVPEMNEAATVIRGRLQSSPDSAWVLEDAQGVAAYLVAYRSVLGKVTALGAGFAPAAVPDTLYLHDLAVAKRARGTRAGAVLVEQAWVMARREALAYSALVSVQNSRAFWTQLGYRLTDTLHPRQAEHLASYSTECGYMTATL